MPSIPQSAEVLYVATRGRYRRTFSASDPNCAYIRSLLLQGWTVEPAVSR